MELIERVCEACASGRLTSEALEKFAPESRLIESEIRLDKASSSQFDPAVQDRVTCRVVPSAVRDRGINFLLDFIGTRSLIFAFSGGLATGIKDGQAIFGAGRIGKGHALGAAK